ncbi:hypothetical protein ACQP0C_11335 [Nocardia sp. CA-129566]|uniref:hypothetical protein n=1 Tax=Nocardia sp. CA-129566 TaxID=3239976 RepID=UPI003D96739B
MTAITELTELESHTREMGSGTVAVPIAKFIADEFDRATAAFPKTADRDLERAHEITADFFRKEVLATGDGL